MPLSEYATREEQEAYVVCVQMTEAFTTKGLTAFYGSMWDGACDHHAATPFWYFHPLNDGGVGIYTEYNDGAYDQYFMTSEAMKGFQVRFAALPEKPSRQEVWAAADAAAQDAITAGGVTRGEHTT